MIVIGLTGSIGMGKSTVANLFKKNGIPVFEADKTVHRLFAKDINLITEILKEFPEALENGEISRQRLSKIVFNKETAWLKLEEIVHKRIITEIIKFLALNKLKNKPAVILEIPLLIEKSWHKFCDRIIVVSCDFNTQQERVLKRPNMTKAKFIAILQRQLDDTDKKKYADLVIDTEKSITEINFLIKRKIKTKFFKKRKLILPSIFLFKKELKQCVK